MRHRERLERKLAKREEWAGKASARSDAAFDAAGKRAEAIPFGQPILVGHHSEKRDRSYRARIHAGMDRGLAEHKLAKHHTSKAAGLSIALETSIYDDDPDAIEKLRAKAEALDATRQTMKAANVAWKRGGRAGVVEILGETGASEAFRRAALGRHERPYPAYALSNMGAEIRRCLQRIKVIEARRKREGEAFEAGGVVVRRHEEHDWCTVTFAEKPEREVLAALRAAGYGWAKGSWSGRLSNLPDEVERAEEQAKAEIGACLCIDHYECVPCERERKEREERAEREAIEDDAAARSAEHTARPFKGGDVVRIV